ncbi:MAG: apolipoprotein N-acyltransferase, partial [bacterium]
QGMKWDQARQLEVLDKYAYLSRAAAREGAGIIVWPETAVPGYLRYQMGLLFRVKNVARVNKVWLIIGSPDYQDEKYYNSVFLISPDGEIAGQYSKMHLVLFGEKIPLRKTLAMFFKIFDELGDYTPGEKISLLETPAGKVGAEICFESVFPDLFRRFVKNGADLMVNVTEDGWYGRTSAPGQHFSVNIFRAVENRVSVVRAANTGISGFIDPYGRPRKISAIFTEDFLTDEVVLREKTTFYTRYGDLFSYLCALITILSLLILVIKRKS